VGIRGFDLNTPRKEVLQANVANYLSQGEEVIVLVRNEADLYRRELRYDDYEKGWYKLTQDADVEQVVARFEGYIVTFFVAVNGIYTTGLSTYKSYNPKTLSKHLSEIWYEARHFNEGLYPPGRIPSRRTFYITNLKVIQMMFDRAGLVYENLRRVKDTNWIQVEISKEVALHFPENLAFVDRDRFWSFTQDGFSCEGYWTMSFHVHAYTRTEAFQINILGQVPEEERDMWGLVPGRPER
jgi:hypothetical protein